MSKEEQDFLLVRDCDSLDHLIRPAGIDGQAAENRAPAVEARATERGKSADAAAIQIVVLRETGMIQPEIADVTGVSLSTVNRANTLTYWKSIENGARGVILTNFYRDFLVAPEKLVSLPGGSRVVCQNGRSGSFLHDNSP
jgi:hypothetical protein